jgi:LemA protein
VGNELDETTGPINAEGRDVNVLEKQLAVETDFGTKVFEFSLWILGFPVAYFGGLAYTGDSSQALMFLPLGLLPGIVFWVMKTNALAYLRKLQQKVQADASQIDNYLEQRVIILQNLSGLLEKSIDVDKDIMKSVAAYRGGVNPNADATRNETSALLEGINARINVAFEAYPDLKSQANIAEAMRQNSNLQKEITAARTLYNDTVATWNREIYSWPTKQIVAAKAGYTTRIPFTASQEMKAAARGTFF